MNFLRHHWLGIVAGVLLTVLIFLIIERQTGGPRPRPAVRNGTIELAPALRDYRAISAEREGRLTDSVLARIDEMEPPAELDPALADLRRHHRELISELKMVNARLLLLLCREMPNYRDCQ